MQVNVKALGAAVAGAGLIAVGFAGTAQADPPAGEYRPIAMAGSDTTQDVVEGLSQVIVDGSGNKLIANYKAQPVGRTVQTKADPDCVLTVPNGSTSGRNALNAALTGATFAGPPLEVGDPVVTSPNMTGCLQAARSSSYSSGAVSAGPQALTYVPFALDGLTYATLTVSSVPKKLTKPQLKSIYQCTLVSGGVPIYEPLLPQPGSGTRSSWLSFLGLTDSVGGANGYGSCVKDSIDGVFVQEHDGRAVTNQKQLVPLSAAVYIGQASGAISDIRGRASLGVIDGSVSLALNPAFTGARTMYNIVPTRSITPGDPNFDQTIVDVFVGSNGAGLANNSKVCQAQSTIQAYGFGLSSSCGSTAQKSG